MILPGTALLVTIFTVVRRACLTGMPNRDIPSTAVTIVPVVEVLGLVRPVTIVTCTCSPGWGGNSNEWWGASNHTLRCSAPAASSATFSWPPTPHSSSSTIVLLYWGWNALGDRLDVCWDCWLGLLDLRPSLACCCSPCEHGQLLLCCYQCSMQSPCFCCES